MAMKKKVKSGHDFPEHLRDFMLTIEIKEDFDDPKERARRAAAKRKQKEAEAHASNKTKIPTNNFTEEDIKNLVKTFKMEFPHGNINKRGTVEAIRKVFPRYDADCVMKNIFEIFDSMNTGKINQNEILWVFSMAMSGTVQQKLQWLFKLYDKDGNGEISQDEMEDVFVKMCKIVEKTEVDHMKKHKKMEEEERRQKALALERKREKEMRKAREELYEGKNRVSTMYSEKKKRLEAIKNKPPAKTQRRKKKAKVIVTVEDDDESEDEKYKMVKTIVDEASHPSRDCKKFDPVKRAKEIFNALDANNDGVVTETEFINGCLSDEIFVKVMDDLCLDFLWGV